MKILVLNGSPRKGNTLTAIHAFVEGASAKHEVEVIDTYRLSVGPCHGCNACKCTDGCMVDKTDDTNPTIDKLVAADLIVFASPVYWWGVTAQLKLIIDKLYCKAAHLQGKSAGLIMVGAEQTDDAEYRIIREQFECIAEFQHWNLVFANAYSAADKDDLAKNGAAIEELRICGAGL